MSDHSLTLFDNDLAAIRLFSAFPAMRPYVGPNYIAAGHKRMLVVGESYYFPDDSQRHLDVERWYGGTQGDLTDEEVAYIHCRELLECDWGSPGHKMYRELNACLAAGGLRGGARPISHIAFMNAFLRPAAVPGESFKHSCHPKDIDTAKEVIGHVVLLMKPDLVVFATKYGWDSVGRFLAPLWPSCQTAFVSHPTDPFHWNVTSYAHGRSKFIEILSKDFIGMS